MHVCVGLISNTSRRLTLVTYYTITLTLCMNIHHGAKIKWEAPSIIISQGGNTNSIHVLWDWLGCGRVFSPETKFHRAPFRNSTHHWHSCTCCSSVPGRTQEVLDFSKNTLVQKFPLNCAFISVHVCNKVLG